MKELGANVLIVEDEGIQALGLEETLEQAGYTVVAITDNGEEVLELVGKEPIDLILMDIHIKGDMDGIDTTWKLREVKPDLPVIFLSAYVDHETTRRAEETLPAGYITKPYRQVTLLSCIETALRRAGNAD
jgi:CheY-like chemotaxis protein